MVDAAQDEIAGLLDFGLELAEAASAAILPYFRKPIAVSNKEDDGFDPVTEADRAGERAMRQLIEARYPDHGILGEEYGAKPGRSGYQWVLDPVDGTRSFISGMPTWMTLIGLTRDGQAVAGVAAQPFVGEVYYGTAERSFCRRGAEQTGLGVRPARSLASAMAATTKPDGYDPGPKLAFLDRLRSGARNVRYDGDAYFFCLLAAGHIDIVLDAGLQSYDIAALIPIIEGAGGVVSTWDGGPATDGGDVLAAASRQLHAEALALWAP